MGIERDCKQLFNTTDLYLVLHLDSTLKDKYKSKEIKDAYYKQSLRVHPDRVPEVEKVIATRKFQVLSKVFQVLSDEKKRKMYNKSGVIDEEELFDGDSQGSKDWLAYWRSVFPRVTIEKMDEFMQKYKGSADERIDLFCYFEKYEGNMDVILTEFMIGYSALDGDDERYEKMIQEGIDQKKIKNHSMFKKTMTKAKKDARFKNATKEAKEAEEMLKENRLTSSSDLEEMIKKNQIARAKTSNLFLDNLAAKYAK